MQNNFHDSGATTRTMAANNSVCEEALWVVLYELYMQLYY